MRPQGAGRMNAPWCRGALAAGCWRQLGVAAAGALAVRHHCFPAATRRPLGVLCTSDGSAARGDGSSECDGGGGSGVGGAPPVTLERRKRGRPPKPRPAAAASALQVTTVQTTGGSVSGGGGATGDSSGGEGGGGAASRIDLESSAPEAGWPRRGHKPKVSTSSGGSSGDEQSAEGPPGGGGARAGDGAAAGSALAAAAARLSPFDLPKLVEVPGPGEPKGFGGIELRPYQQVRVCKGWLTGAPSCRHGML